MKRFLFLIASSILFLASLATSWADSFVMEAGNGKKLYKWDGKHLMAYTNGRKLFKWDGQHIMLYSNMPRPVDILTVYLPDHKPFIWIFSKILLLTKVQPTNVIKDFGNINYS